MSAETAQILRKAAERIQSKGWCQGVGQDGQGRGCALFSIARSAVDERAGLEATWAVTRRLGIGPFDLYVWNDDPLRREHDVVKAFLETADAEEFTP